MQKVARTILLFALFTSPLAVPANSFAEPLRGHSVPEEYYRDPVPACEQDFNMPEVHNLPMGVGDVTVKKCFNNGFTTITPHTEEIGSCEIALKSQEIIDRGNIAYDQSCLKRYPRRPEQCEINCEDTPAGLKEKPECTPGKLRIIRRKYHCRFKGAGAVIESTGDVRTSGSRVYFRGEEPKNYTTKDPGCKKIFQNLFTKENKYGYLE